MKTLQRILCVILLSTAAFGQAQPIPQTAPYENHGAYSINLQNLSVVLNFSFRDKSGLIPFSATGQSTANIFGSGPSGTMMASSTTVPSVQSPQSQIRILNGGSTTIQCPNQSNTTKYSGWSIVDNSANTHTTVLAPGSNSYVDQKADGTSCQSNMMTVVTTDGSGLTAVIGSAPLAAKIYDSSGGYLSGSNIGGGHFTFASYTDSNGNVLSSTGIAIPQVFTDSLSTTPVLTVSDPGVSPVTFAWTDVNSNTQKVSASFTKLTGSTAFGCPSPSLDSTASAQWFYLSNVAYANSTNLAITYEQTPGKSSAYTTGRITNLKLPEGGNVGFSYTAFQCAYLEPTKMTRTTSDGSWTYTWAPLAGNIGNTTTVVDPAGNTTVYTFNAPVVVPITSSAAPVLVSKATAASTTTYCYNAAANCTTPVTFPITQIDTYTTLAGMAVANHTKKTFDSLGNLVTSSVYDFGASVASFTTAVQYGTWNGVSGGGTCSAIGSYVSDKACYSITTDAGNHAVSQIYNTYDAKGNKTSSTIPTGTSNLVSSTAYNGNGTTATHTDVSGVVTTYTYGDCSGAFPTQVNVGGLSTYNTWDCNGGVLLTTADDNQQSAGVNTTYGYKNAAGVADPLWRVSSITDPLGNIAYAIYGANTLEHKFSFGSSLEDSITTADSYGRPIRKQTKHGSLYDTVTTKYNVAANTVSTSVPCTVALGADCTTGFTISTFDVAGRTTSAVGGGGLTLATTFTSKDVVSTLSPHPTGENNKVVQSEIDGLGRTRSTCAIEATGGTACGQVAGGSGILTTLGYTTAAGSSTTTATRGVQTRTTVKDALGRATSQTDPETGTVNFYWDLASPDCSYPMAGKLFERKDAAGVINCYHYDPLGRLNTISAGTVCRIFAFDSLAFPATTPPTGYVLSNPVGRMIEAYTNNCTGGAPITDEWFSYDVEGHVTDMWELTPNSGSYYHSTATYFPNGQLNTASIPGLGTITYTLDGDGKPSSAKQGTLTLVSGVTYGPVGPLTISLGSSTDKDIYTYYGTTGRMNTFQFNVGAKNAKGTLTWNANGTLGTLAVVDGFSATNTQTCAFSYDDLARLTGDNCNPIWAQTFTYDKYDNLNQFGSAYSTSGYNTANNHYTLAGTSYDAAGNVTSDSLNTYTYDAFNKLTLAVPVGKTCANTTFGGCYVYDAFGQAVELSDSTGHYPMVYGPLGKTALMSGQTLQYAYVPLPGGSFSIYFSGKHNYTHKDWLGSGRTASTIPASGAGVIYYSRSFAPYSQMYGNFGSTGSPTFTGDTGDLDSGLFDTPNRELAQSQGRWLTPDPARSGWNLYAYGTDPNTGVDPSGLAFYPRFEFSLSGLNGGVRSDSLEADLWNSFQMSDSSVSADDRSYIGDLADENHANEINAGGGGEDAVSSFFLGIFNRLGLTGGSTEVDDNLAFALAASVGNAKGAVIGDAIDAIESSQVEVVTSSIVSVDEATAASIPENPLFDRNPGQTGWSFVESGPPSRGQYGSYQGWISARIPGRTFDQLDKAGVKLPLGGYSGYYAGLAGEWRFSDHAMMDVRSFMTSEQIQEYGGTMHENGSFWTFSKPITTFKLWSDF